MRIEINAEVLAESVAVMARIAPRKETKPVYQYMLMEVANGALTLSATDGIVALRRVVPLAGDHENGSVLVQSRRFADLSRLIRPDLAVSIQTTKKRQEVAVKAGDFASHLSSLPVTEFPTIEWPSTATQELPGLNCADCLAKVEFAIAEHDPRFATNGAHLIFEHDLMTVVGTDGYRVNIASASVPTDQALSVIVPRRAIPELKALLQAAGQDAKSYFCMNDNHLYFICGASTLMTQVIDGKFPNQQRILDRIVPAATVVCDRQALSSALRRVTVVGDDTGLRSVTLTISKGALSIYAYGDQVGEASEPVPGAEVTGDAMAVAFNGNFLIQSVAAADGPLIRLEVSSDGHPMKIIQVDEALTSYTVLLAPMTGPSKPADDHVEAAE